ncbi:right-handed parallel beta-helix repeat-containing protein [Citricoccus zhacaiensis]|uniref:right-handed parallel beta-helix repeat-containing protein n=1 Tax=Citricoccus zhacaiensis TaxID=489142 RepID=UPI003CFA2586
MAHTAVRLLRLAEGETCKDIGPRLADDLSGHGRLTVSLEPTTVVGGDCPVTEGGGYEGLEHNLYRIEIIGTADGSAMFAWSPFNGGLVGRGVFHGGAGAHVDITANRAAILNSGLGEFYLEAVEFDPDRGHHRVTYGTPATLNADGELDLVAPAPLGSIPGTGEPVFFRLWNGIAPVGDFIDAAAPEILRDGIRLSFTPPAGTTYRPGSWWTFEVRAGEIPNAELLVDNAPPFGPQVSRVPLAEITWTAAGDTAVGGEIEDCRTRFRPLTNQKGCCTYLVGNGTTTFGDFNSLEEAAAHLPPEGGQLCLLPGVHVTNLKLVGRTCVTVSGCRHRTILFPRPAAPDEPVVRVEGGRDLTVSGVDIIAPLGNGLEIAGEARDDEADIFTQEVTVQDCRVLARRHGIRVDSARDVSLLRNQVWLLDQPDGISTISLRTTDALIEDNRTGVWPVGESPQDTDGGGADDARPDPTDPCFSRDDLKAHREYLIRYANRVWRGGQAAASHQPYRAQGGIHLRAECERVDLRRNHVVGGLGHGIMLGGTVPGDGGQDGGDDGDRRPPLVQVERNLFVARVQLEDGSAVTNHTLTLRRTNGGDDDRLSGITNVRGLASINAESGEYRLHVEPGHEVREIRQVVMTKWESYVVVIARVDRGTGGNDSAFLSSIRIMDNEIEGMGLSGIGFGLRVRPRFTSSRGERSTSALLDAVASTLSPVELLRTTDPVRGLVIRDNRIADNLRIKFTDEMRQMARSFVQGGISLAFVERLTIEGNDITGNGTDAANPSAGVFLAYGEDVVIASNRIEENAPVTGDYRERRSEGLRGGIVIRLASSLQTGAGDDGSRKPALVIRDNVVDQTAGRAVTVLAFGPVSCVGNTLNAEYEGAWGVFDEMVGAVLIVNLGGIHRHLGHAPEVRGGDFMKVAAVEQDGTRRTHRAYARTAEILLPSGETLFNSNVVRTGPGNRSWISQLIVAADDLGYDGNQSSMFRPDLTLTNLLGIAHSLRVTDSRFSEEANTVAASALTLAAGTTAGAQARAMNTTILNQGDHCILALSSGAVPLLEEPNQVADPRFCPGTHTRVTKEQYMIAAVLYLWRQVVEPEYQHGQDHAIASLALEKAAFRLSQFQMQAELAYSAEVRRLASAYGTTDPRTLELNQAVRVRKRKAAVLGVQAEMARVREAAVPETGALLDGRVTDVTGRAVGDAVVQLLESGRGEARISASVDDQGYYAIELDVKLLDWLSQIPATVRATDLSGTVLGASSDRVVLGTSRRIRRDIIVEQQPLRVDLEKASPVFTRAEDDAPGQSAARSTTADQPTTAGEPVEAVDEGADAEKDAPIGSPDRSGTGKDDSSGSGVGIEQVKGIGAARARRLRAEGIDTAQALLDVPEDRLATLLGRRAPMLRQAAQDAINAAHGES